MGAKATTLRKAKLGWVPLEQMRVREEISQRPFDAAWANVIAKDFDPESFSPPTVNHYGEWYWIVDGQHRTAAYKLWLPDWSGQKVECWIYEDLSEKEEADLFDRLNTAKAVKTFDKFRVRLTAEREEETNIEAIVRLKKLKISASKSEGSVSCVATLTRVYRRGADILSRDLDIAYKAFGDSGLDADIIGGIGALVGRYNGQLDDAKAIRALNGLRGGINTLRNRAAHLRQQTGTQRTHCIAAAAVEVINRGSGGKKLPSWWKLEKAEAQR